MRARELELKLAKMLDYPEGQIDQRMRPLREIGVLPVGGRGPNAPAIGAVHAAVMLLQMVSLRATDALQIGLNASNLQFVPVPGVTDAFFGVQEGNRLTLGGALAYLLSDPKASWYRLEVQCDGMRAWVMIDHFGQPLELLFDGDAEFSALLIDGDLSRYRHQGIATFGHRFVMGAGQVKQIAFHLANRMEAGWTGEPKLEVPSSSVAQGRVTPDEAVTSFRELLAASTIEHQDA